MSSIDTRLKALEDAVQQIRNALPSADAYSGHANRRGPRRSIRLQDSEATPSLLEEVLKTLNYVSGQLVQVQEDVRRGSAMLVGESETLLPLNDNDALATDKRSSCITQAPTPPSPSTSGEPTPAVAAGFIACDDAGAHAPELSRSPSGIQRQYVLSVEQMGKHSLPHLAKFVNDPDFKGMVRVEVADVNWEDVMERIDIPDRPEFLAVQYAADTAGMSRVRLANPVDPSALQPPDMSQRVGRPSDAEAEAFLNEAAEAPPDREIFYFIGEPLLTDFDHLLHSGDELCRLPRISGANTTWWHYGDRFSATAYHLEDGEKWYSSNLVIGGWKLWIVIWARHRTRFEAFVRRRHKGGDCAHFVRHQSLFVGPRTLKAEGIEFTMHCAGPGDMVVVRPGEYHCVVNWSPCVAIATNFVLPGETALPDGLAVCKDCGLYNLQDRRLRKVPPSPVEDSNANGADSPVASNHAAVSAGNQSKQKRGRTELPSTRPLAKRPRGHSPCGRALKVSQRRSRALSALDDMVMQITSLDGRCSIPSFDSESGPTPDVLKLAAAIRSRHAILQLLALIKSQRDLNIDRPHPMPRTEDDQLQRCIRAIAASEGHVGLRRLRTRLNQVKLAEMIAGRQKGRIRADTTFIKRLKAEVGWNKSNFDYHRGKGSKWKAVAGIHDGLLCYILEKASPFQVSADQYLQLDTADLRHLHDLLDDEYATRIFSASKAFQDSLLDPSKPVQFRCESSDTCLLTCDEKEMLYLIQPVPFVNKNIWDEKKFLDRVRPAGWPASWSWPADPTMIPDTEQQCDFCDDTPCGCDNTSNSAPQIKSYGSKGLGLQAVASEPGGIAYEKGALLGMLYGEIYPPESYDDDRTLDFVRPDLPDEPVVCQIRVTELGNCFRLLNHALDPSAYLVQKRRGGKYVTAVLARRKIMDAEEITISYGSGALIGKG